MMTPGAQTTGDIAVYGSAKQLVIFLPFTPPPVLKNATTSSL